MELLFQLLPNSFALAAAAPPSQKAPVSLPGTWSFSVTAAAGAPSAQAKKGGSAAAPSW